MKRLLFTALLLSVAVILSHEGKTPQVVAQSGETSAVTKLLIERRDTLRSIEDLHKRQIQSGAGGYVELIRATMARLEAELDLADSNEERIATLEKKLEETKKLERMVQERLKNGAANELEILRIRVERLEAEIALERTKTTTQTRQF